MSTQKYSIILLLFIKVLRSSCDDASSLTFVIDDTKSMWNDIEQVKAQVNQIMDVALEEKSSEIKDFVLVSFNDPDITFLEKTSDRTKFQRSVNSLWAHNYINVDCPEMAMGGIKRALEESNHGSYVFVFTDASAKDYLDYMQVIDLCQSKQSQVVFVLTGDCRKPESEKVAVYYKISAACSGQVFKISKTDVTTMIDLIRVKIRGKKSLLTSRVIPPFQLTNIPFNVDEKVESVLVTTSGEHVSLKIRLPSRDVTVKTLMWTDNSKAIELTDLVSGQYSAVVSGQSSTSIVVTGRTDFSFHHGFSMILPRASNETVTQPIADESNFLSITVTDPDSEITVETAQILDINENVLIELPLYRVHGNFFTTDEFRSPNHMIKIAVTGTVKRNGQTLRRISKTPVQPKIITIRPIIDKSHTKFETTNASTVKIPCKILVAKPKPTIFWYFKTASSLSYEPLPDNMDELTLNINSFSLSGTFKCVAENAAGRDEHDTELIVTSKPKIIIDKGPKISVKYGSTISVTSYVSANPEPKVEWRDDNNVVIPSHTRLSQNHKGETYNEYASTITLNNINHSGKYYCYSSNSRGSTVEAIDVTVLSPFQRHGLQEETMNLGYGKSYIIPCKVNSELPVKIKWFFKSEKSSIMETLKPSDKYYLSSNGSTLIINYMDLELRGKYRCSVTLISDEKENQSYDVNLYINDLMEPKLTTSVYLMIVKENTSATISCKILQGVPKPTVTWYFKRKEMDTFQSLSNVGEQLNIKSALLADAGIYKCVAMNALGNHEVTAELVVEAPARINNKFKIFKGLIGDVALRIPCNVTGYPKPDISWALRKGGENIVKDQKYYIEDGALVINNPVVADTKAYWCTAKNTLGSDTQSFNGIVTEDVDYENVHEVYILQGESKKVKCLLPHITTDSVRWFKNGNLMNITGSYLNFVNATVFMDGNYTCRVSNSLGSNSDTILVDVGYVPNFTILVRSNITDWKGEGDLNCEVSAKPTATAEWFYNGQPLESARNIFQLDIFDWGKYSCRIKNVHGTVERIFSVSSKDCLLNRDNELAINAPVILSELSTWPDFKTTNKYLTFDSGEKLKLVCPNTPSAFQKFPGKNEIDITCDHENKLVFEEKPYKYSDFHCDRQVMPVIKKTGNRCLSENSETIRVGFSGKTFIEAYEVCLDTQENLPLYTYITLTKARYHASGSWLKWFKLPEIMSKRQDTVYSCGNNATSCCYTKGQLVNATDVTFGPMQTSTYVDYINAVPIWLPCTERTSWSEIEDVLRTQLIIQPTLSVWSGASKYTERNGGKIPRYLWKVVKGSEDLIIAVVYVNEPTPKEDDIFCKNICDGDTMLWLIPKDKFTYCCTLEDFLVAFKMPESIFV